MTARRWSVTRVGNMPSMDWPDPPSPGRTVEVPLALPPMLPEALGYEGGARQVGFWWSPVDRAVHWSDGGTAATGYALGWAELLAHPAGRRALGPYDLGGGPKGGRHRLLADRWEGTLHVGLPEDVDGLLATQPSVIAMAVDEVGEDAVREAIEEALARASARPPDEVRAAVEAHRRRERELAGSLRSWLDSL